MKDALPILEQFNRNGITYSNPVPDGRYIDENPIFDVDVMKNGVKIQKAKVCVIIDQEAVIILPR